MNTLQRIALVFTIIGALNWGLIGFFQYDLVADLFGGVTSPMARLVYAIVGLCGLINIGLFFFGREVRGQQAAHS